MIVSKSNVLKCGVAPVALGIAMIFSGSSALAQTAPALPTASTPVADNSADTIIVTGSRIARPQTQASVPVAVVTATSIQDAGQSNLVDALKDLPIAGQSLDASSSNFFNNVAGVATINLRNLGSSRTLVLINGRRTVGVPGDSAVDLNNIPVDLIDHVEIATGGASAVYGSDAVAGVVNIILKNDFTGLDMHAENNISDKGDAHQGFYSITAGHDFFEDKGHITANFSYTKNDALPSSARSFSANDSPTGSAFTPAGSFFDQNGDAFTFDRNNNVVPQTFSAAQRFNRASDRLLVDPVERYSGSILGHYDFSPAAELYFEAMYNKTYASTMIEPAAIADPNALGQYIQGETVQNFDGSTNYAGIPTVNNPFVPAAIVAAAGGLPLDFYKRSTGIFDRSEKDNRDYYRGVIGLKGDIGGSFRYDFYYEHSHTRDDSVSGAILMTNYGAALQATTNASGQVVCADPAAAAAGCVPINIFGNQPYTAAQLHWLTTYEGGVNIPGATIGQHVDDNYLQKDSEDVANFSITGQPFKLPGGQFGFAAGGEYRRESVSAVFDPFTQSGYSSAQLNGNESGNFNTKEEYVEFEAPIFGHHPGVYALTLEGAARHADYTTVGSVWTYKYGGTYAPIPDLRFRAVYARAVRAPNLGELYAARANTAQNVVDPCDQGQGVAGASGLSSLPAGCLAIPGIANYVAAHGNFVYSLAQVQTIFGFTGGNADLKAEATNTFTAGAVLTPQFLRSFSLTADYYNIKVKNAITSGIDPQTSVTDCFNTGNPQYCQFVTRNANGFITEVDQLDANASSYQVAGIDVQADYTLRPHWFGPGEKINLDMYYNHKFKQQQTPFGGGLVSKELGTADLYAGQQLGTGFKDQFTFNADYSTGPVTIHYRLKYLGPVSASYGATTIPISAYWYHDLQLKFDVQKRFEFYVGVDNLTDKAPPFIVGGESQFPGTNTVADTYDVLGRMLYAGVHAKF